MSSDSGRTADLAQVIAGNIAQLRKSGGMTQAGLAEQLGYSDKSVSKWERAEGVPDVICLKKIADLFGVTVDYFLCTEHEPENAVKPEEQPKEQKSAVQYVTSRKAIVLLSAAGVWMLAAVVYVIVLLCGRNFPLPFVFALPVTALLLLIFHAMWGDRTKFRRGVFAAVTLLIWTVLFMVCYICRAYDLWLLMVLGFPATIVAALACAVKKKAVRDENQEE
ncbi:MAG: helix-turn-helix transcriptional regulator [Clostridia bacterium]|nr:helix-turn-helix transcriptional regulator [Clostridia bacterium]